MKYFFLLLIACCNITARSQHLKPGFDKKEYTALMALSARFGDSAYSAKIPLPPEYRFVYRSPVVGLENCWDLWMHINGVAVISVRGTTASPVSWIANFYAAMVPATGTLQLSPSDTFSYQLAANPRAAVHVGWLLSTAYLCKTMLPKIDSLYNAGTREILLIGHSQGGAITYLLNAYLHYRQQQGLLPAGIRFKTYCSAGPKPGNLYFAYDYESYNQQGWAYNVVNAADWVPETPLTVQTLNDFNTVNPFTGAGTFIKKQPWPRRWALRYAYGRMNNPARKTARNYRKYLGKFVAKSITKQLPSFKPPVYAETSDYVRAGFYIVLTPDEEYYRLFPQSKENIFINHLHPPYLNLTGKLPD